MRAAERGVKRYPASGPLLKAAGTLILQENSSSDRAGELLERATEALRRTQYHYAYGLWALMNHREVPSRRKGGHWLSRRPTISECRRCFSSGWEKMR